LSLRILRHFNVSFERMTKVEYFIEEEQLVNAERILGQATSK
jgi:hypothetical protein